MSLAYPISSRTALRRINPYEHAGKFLAKGQLLAFDPKVAGKGVYVIDTKASGGPPEGDTKAPPELPDQRSWPAKQVSRPSLPVGGREETKDVVTEEPVVIPPAKVWKMNHDYTFDLSSEEIDFFPWNEEKGYEASTFLDVGKNKAGKSHWGEHFILYHMITKPILKYGIVFSPTHKMNKEWSFLPQDYLYDEYSEDVLLEWVKKQEKLREELGEKECPMTFIIFNDVVGLVDTKTKGFNHFITVCRHAKISVLFLIQKVENWISTTMRSQVRWWIVFRTVMQDEMESLYKRVGGAFENMRDFKQWFKTVMGHDKYLALVFDSSSVEKIEDAYHMIKAPGKIPKVKVSFEDTSAPPPA